MALTCRGDYEIIGKPLGKGGFATAYRVLRKSDRAEFVVKEADISDLRKLGADDTLVETLKREFQILRQLDHPNIVQVFNEFEESSDGREYYCIVMQYYEGGNLQDAILDAKKVNKFFEESLVLRWIFQLVSVVKYLHDKNYVHRDIKPHNIFLTNSQRIIKVGDFGIAKCQESVRRMPGSLTFLLTPEYSSPEFKTQRHPFCFKCDVFSLGATFHQLVSLTSYPVLMTDRELPPRSRAFYSPELCSFAKWLVAENEDDRPTISQVAGHECITIKAAEAASKDASLRRVPTGKASVEMKPLTKITSQWIAAIVERQTHHLAFGYGGDVIALSKDGESVLWRTKIKTKVAGIWHAAIDEKRKRLFVCFHWRFDVTNAAPVDVFAIDISNWKVASAPPQPIIPELFFHRRDWQCYSLTVVHERDIILICDWFHGKIGVWDLAKFGRGDDSSPPMFEISTETVRPLKELGFRPTRCATLPISHSQNIEMTTTADLRQVTSTDAIPLADLASYNDDAYLLAVTDWSNDCIHLLKITFSLTTANNNVTSCSLVKTIATDGKEVGNVKGPVDIKFDVGSDVLVICDQMNCRVQFLIPNKFWPDFKTKTIPQSLGHYFSAIAVEGRTNALTGGGAGLQATNELLVLVGLNTGDLVQCSLFID